MRSAVLAAMSLLCASGAGAVPGAQETITGRPVGAGATCPQFRLPDGEVISLSGIDDRVLPEGERLRLRGTWQPRGICMQGREFRVSPPIETP